MNDVSCGVRAAAIERAARVLEQQQLQVLDRDWTWDEHYLDLVATPGAGIMAAVEVMPVAAGTPGVRAATLTETRFREAAGAVRAWARQHRAMCKVVWIVLVTVDPAAGLHVLTANAAAGVA